MVKKILFKLFWALSLIYKLTALALAQDSFKTGHDEFLGIGQGVKYIQVSQRQEALILGNKSTNYTLWLAANTPSQPYTVDHPGVIEVISISPSGKRSLTSSEDGTLILHNLETRQSLRHVSLERPKMTVASSGRYHAFATQNNVVYAWQELSWAQSSNQSRVYKLYEAQKRILSLTLSPNGQYLTIAMEGGLTLTHDFTTGRFIERDHDKDASKIVYSNDSQFLVTYAEDKEVWFGHPSSEDYREFDAENYVRKLVLSQDQKKILLLDSNSQAWIYDINRERLNELKEIRPITYGAKALLADVFFLANTQGDIAVYNFQTLSFRLLKFPKFLKQAALSFDGQKLVAISTDGLVKIYDLQRNITWQKDFARSTSELQILANHALVQLGDDSLVKISLDLITSQKIISVIPPTSPSFMLEAIRDWEFINSRGACDGEAVDTKWAGLIPRKDTINGAIPYSLAVRLLMRMQLASQLNLAQDFPLILALAKSPIPQQFPGSFSRVLQNVLRFSNAAYEEIIAQLPPTFFVDHSSDQVLNCRPKSDELSAIQGAKRYVLELKNRHPVSSWARDWKGLFPLIEVLKKLPSDLVESDTGYIDHIAATLSENTNETESCNGVFISQVYKYTEVYARKLFGLETTEKSSLYLLRQSSEATGIALSTSKIDGPQSSETNLGFHCRRFTENKLALPQYYSPTERKNFAATKEFQWRTFGQEYKAVVQVQSINSPAQEFVPRGDAPQYSGMWKDGMLTGMVVTGVSLKERAQVLLKEYVDYFTNQGFHIDQTHWRPVIIANFIEEKVTSGELDYFIKESHSDGDVDNVVKVSLKGRVVEGVRPTSERGSERIYLVFPDPESPGHTYISNNNFGAWIRRRAENRAAQMAYFNTSCSSRSKAICEIQSCGSPLLLDIPAHNSVTEFCNYPLNAQFLLFTAFRDGKNYEGIRRELTRNDAYRMGTGNGFMFPDEPRYFKEITSEVKVPLIFNILTYENGHLLSDF